MTAVHLAVVGTVPGADDAAFQQLASTAKKDSRLLTTTITMTTKPQG